MSTLAPPAPTAAAGNGAGAVVPPRALAPLPPQLYALRDRPEPAHLPLVAARGSALVALAVFGGLHWMRMIESSPAWRAWVGALIAVGLIAVLVVAARLPRVPRLALAGVGSVAALAFALLAGGIADELLKPARWDQLTAGIERGISALPGARVPYRGLDDWLRTVIQLGGTFLIVLSAALAFWPRRGRTGYPLAALIVLIALYATPAVSLDFGAEFVRGAVLALLVVAFLRLERVRLPEGRAAGVAGLAAVVVALVAAPALDGEAPWFDYESWALETSTSRSAVFSWEHSYGTLNWPRDGREVLRVRARFPAYWKAQNLDRFADGRWQVGTFGLQATGGWDQRPRNIDDGARWVQKIRVSIRNLRSRELIMAGVPIDLNWPGRQAFSSSTPGIYVGSRNLRRGDAYEAYVYTPRPRQRDLRDAGNRYEDWLWSYRMVWLRGIQGSRGTGVLAPEFGEKDLHPIALRFPGRDPFDATDLVEASDLRRVYALAVKLRAQARTPYEYVQAVDTYLQAGFSYSETPPPQSRTLDGFLFDSRIGYCQQFSGAMALLLRLGGVPARVSTGFTTGSLDTDTKEYVVRDYDAHSWVEAWFPKIGWVTFDPTPAAAPSRAQPRDGRPVPPALGDVGDLGAGQAASDPRLGSAAGADDGGPSLIVMAVIGVLAAGALALVATLLWQARRGTHISPIGELDRALRRVGRAAAPGTTLHVLESGFAGSPGAAAYVRALREQRYGAGGGAPTRRQRRALRSALGRGGGPAGRLRAWWALPPRLR